MSKLWKTADIFLEPDCSLESLNIELNKIRGFVVLRILRNTCEKFVILIQAYWEIA